MNKPVNSPAFPITEVMPAILQVLESHTRLVLEAPPGAGKTTQVPLALLQAPWCEGRKILLLEPRRVAARAAAMFMAQLLDEQVGQTVGYRIRFENKVSSATRVEVVTEGILTRMLQDDPLLEGVGAILFDEFHERHLAGDLGLALALDVQSGVREDLRLVVMSATLDGERLAAFLGAERISSAGRAYPVRLEYFPAQREESLARQVKRCLEQALPLQDGDALVFLPGQREITEVSNLLQGSVLLRDTHSEQDTHPTTPNKSWDNHSSKATHSNKLWDTHSSPHSSPDIRPAPSEDTHLDQAASCTLVKLYGDMPVEQQSAALAPDPEGRRRIILATNIAESSVTLPGVRVVVDSGLAREPRFDPNSGFSRLQTVYVSQASADQRMGRAGRVATGVCYRLWSKEQRLDAARTPEMFTVDLAGLALELAAWGSSDLRFVDAPPAGTYAAARDLLQQLGALDPPFSITTLGKRMLTLGTHPRLAAMLLSAQDDATKSLACDMAALIEGRDPLIAYRGDDWKQRWLALQKNGSQSRDRGQSKNSAVAAIGQSASQWRKRLRCERVVGSTGAQQLGAVLMHAYPDRIARQHPDQRLRYQLSNGRMARLSEDSTLIGEPWLVVSELRFDSKDSLILRAAPVDEKSLHEAFAQRFTEADVVRWDDKSRSLISRRETRFDQIVLLSKPAGKVDPEQAASALCAAVAEYGLACLPWSDQLQQWRTRVYCLRQWLPELNLPDLTDASLLARRDEWLKPAFQGKARLDALSATELSEALHALLDWNTQQQVDKEAPVRIEVPSGLERPITYAEGASPVLAVKLQELFGLAATPCIARGRVPLTLHLLSPGGKPLQITQDLKSFWERTYPEVKKEMKGRYPKHPWPDDPWSARPSHRAKPRGT